MYCLHDLEISIRGKKKFWEKNLQILIYLVYNLHILLIMYNGCTDKSINIYIYIRFPLFCLEWIEVCFSFWDRIHSCKNEKGLLRGVFFLLSEHLVHLSNYKGINKYPDSHIAFYTKKTDYLNKVMHINSVPNYQHAKNKRHVKSTTK